MLKETSHMKIRIWLTSFATIVITALLAINTASAQGNGSPALKRITSSNTLTVAMSAKQPPFNVKNRDGKTIGLDVDLAQLLANSMGVELKIVEMPFANLQLALEEGDVDLIISGMTATLRRNTRIAFAGPYFISGISILTTSNSIAAAENAADLNHKQLRIAALKRSTSAKFAAKLLPDSELSETASHRAAVQLLLDGKVDAVVADATACALSMLRYPNAGLTTLQRPLTIEPIGIAIAPNDPLLINLVENYIAALEATGAMAALQDKWFGNGTWLTQVP
jgi:polar amino acid transport system substrate-binding protein